MKINQVEELVGITKKNIRYYEEEGLISPNRNEDNGYRDYNLDDVDRLQKIKLLRQLAVPIEDIRLLVDNKLTFDDCMEKQLIQYNHQKHSLEMMDDMCKRMSVEVDSLDELDAAKYLGEMKKLEEGGTRFMDVSKKDTKKSKKVGPITAAVIVLLYTLAVLGILAWASIGDFVGSIIFFVLLGVSLVVFICIIVVLRQRLKEIDGGEEDEASKY